MSCLLQIFTVFVMTVPHCSPPELSNCSLPPESLPGFTLLPIHDAILPILGEMTILSEFLRGLERLNLFQIFIGYIYFEKMMSAFIHFYMTLFIVSFSSSLHIMG